jgi:hypothetical protein
MPSGGRFEAPAQFTIALLLPAARSAPAISAHLHHRSAGHLFSASITARPRRNPHSARSASPNIARVRSLEAFGRRPQRRSCSRDGPSSEIRLHVERIEAAHVARRIDAIERYGRHSEIFSLIASTRASACSTSHFASSIDGGSAL